jgi:hypothetical protein
MREGKMHRADRFLGVFRQHEDAKTSTLLETVGAEEIRKVWKRYGLEAQRFDPIISARFFNSVIRNGDKFAAEKKMLPGCLPGVGYDYDQVWGGLLDDPRLPPLAETSAA